MRLFGIGKILRSPATEYQDIVDRYQRLQPLRLRLNRELVQRLTKDVLDEGAKKLGILRRGVYVFDDEDQSSVLMDYCIYNVFRGGHSAVGLRRLPRD